MLFADLGVDIYFAKFLSLEMGGECRIWGKIVNKPVGEKQQPAAALLRADYANRRILCAN